MHCLKLNGQIKKYIKSFVYNSETMTNLVAYDGMYDSHYE